MIRTLLIGLDGCTFDVVDDLISTGVMPFLGSFFESGARAPLRTIVPALTPPAWTSLMTGRKPGQHGVFDFFRRESLESRHIRFFSSQDVNCDTVWTLASRSGLRVNALNFPAMFPAPPVNGCVVPGWVPWRQLRLACRPSGLFDRLKALPGFDARELAMDIKLEERATEGCDDRKEYEPWIALHIRRERNWLRVMKFLASEEPAELAAVLFDGVDKLQHLCWRFLRPEAGVDGLADWELRIREQCLEYFRSLDYVIEELCEMAGPHANVVIASDHGFGPTWQVFHVNAWLESKGYLTWSKAALDAAPSGATLGVGQVARHTWMLDWSRTKAFAATPTSNGIHIVTRHNGEPHGIAPEEYESFRRQLIDDLRQLRDTRTDEPLVSGIWTREEAYAGPMQDFGPDLTLELKDGGLVSILPSTNNVRPRTEIAGTHRPIGVFAARGPAIRKGLRNDELSILDVAPTLMHLCNLPLHESFEGSLPEGIFDESWLRQNRPSWSSYPVEEVAQTEQEAPPMIAVQDEQAIADRLRELGYIE